MVGIGLLGCGRIGRMHAANIARHARLTLVATYDVNAAAAKATADDFGAKWCDGVEAVLAHPQVEAVLIASSTDTHADLIEAAAKAGKAVFCEKPIDLSLARINRCRAAIQAYDVPIQIGFNRRFDPGHKAAREAMLAGEIGDLHQVIITARDPELPPRGYLEVAGGLMRDMTVHDFDLARYMLDDEPVEVFAIAGALVDPELGRELNEHDTTMIVMRTADGKMCHINNSRTAVYGYDQRIELLGRKGMLLSDNRRPHELRRHSAAHSGISAPYLYFFIERYREAFLAQLDAFADSVENGTPCVVGFEDGRRAAMLAETAYRSLASGRMEKVTEEA